jgi:glyoxylase-like metal-dependent hydrolase (beta-lactamase superfamily II)
LEGSFVLKNSLAVAALIGLAVSVAYPLSSFAAQPAPSASQALVNDAFKAMGLGDQYVGEATRPPDMLVTLTAKGSVQAWDPGESESVSDLTKPDAGTSTFVQLWDHAQGLYHTEWSRPRPAGGMRTYTEIYAPDGGYVVGNDSNGGLTSRAVQGPNNQPLHTMSGLRLRALLREQERTYIVIAMHENPARIADYPAQSVGGKRYPAVQYRGDNGTFIVMFDPATHLPAVVRTRDFDQLMGDADFDATFSDWRTVEQIKLPGRIAYTLNGVKIFDIKIDSYVLNTSLPTDAFNAPRPLRDKAAKPAPIGTVPYQWVLRRLATGFYLDSDALYTDDGGSLKLTDVAPNVSLVTGGSHNTLIVATNSYLVAFEAPGHDGQSKIAIDLAKQKYPGKPFRYLVLTHHHIDHSGGLRAYAAEGATLIVGKGDGAFFRKVLAAPQGYNLHPVKSVPPKVIEVADKWSVNDGGREIDAFLLENPHAQGYLMPYVPDAKLGFVTDLWNPGPPVMNANPAMAAVVKGAQARELKPERFAGGHGAVGNYADLEKAVQAQGGAR